ncbi:V-type ATPase subunit [bacterium]|nr:V-type ATPase subunit [bacterium]
MTLSGDLDYIHAKVHGMRSRLYEAQRLDGLCELRAISQLWHRLYPDDPQPGDHHALQRRLLADHIHALDVLCQHLPGRLAALTAWMLRRFQLENLKVILRARQAGEPFERVERYLAPLPSDLAMPARALLQTTSLADFLLLVPVPALRKAGEQGVVQQAETGEAFFVELAMERGYYEGLLEQHAQLPAAHRRSTEHLVRCESEIHTLLCVFRLKLNYELPYETAQRYFVPGTFDTFRLERLYSYPAFDDMLKLIPRHVLPPEQHARLHTIADLERALWQQLLHAANRQFYRSVGDLGAVVAFFAIKRVELANLIRVIEGVRYGMPPHAIRQGIIRVEQRTAV